MQKKHRLALRGIFGKVVLVSLIGLVSALVLGTLSASLERPGILPETRITPSAPHTPINLVGNAALVGWPEKTGGMGTSWADAVVIKDFVIDASGTGSCILIQNTTAFLVIKNCTLTNSGGNPDGGIKLVNCTNVNITQCVASNNWIGLFLVQVNDSTIDNNNVTGNTNNGILLEDSHDNFIVKNNASANAPGNGIMISDSSSNTIRNNTCANNDAGIYIVGSDGNTIRFNSISNCNSVGIEASSSLYNEISNNTIAQGQNIGIYMFFSNWNTIRWNTVSGSSTYGISAEYSDYVTINENDASETSATCCGLISANHCTVNNNDFTTTNGNERGIAVTYCNNITIQGNIIQAFVPNSVGILLGGSQRCGLANNALAYCGILITATTVNFANSHQIDTTNTLNGFPIYYHANQTMLSNGDVAGAGEIILANCNDSAFSGLSIANSSAGVLLLFCRNVLVEKSTIESCASGIKLIQSTWCQVNESTFRYCSGYPIDIDSSNNNTIAGNLFEKNSGYGCYISYSESNRVLARNNFTGNTGIRFWNSHYNTVSNNSFATLGSPIEFQNARGNRVELNNLSCTYNPGVSVQFSSNNNIIERNNITTHSGGNGINVFNSNDILIWGNNITNTNPGIALTNSNATIVRGNRISNSMFGITLDSCSVCLIYGNNISSIVGNRALSNRVGAMNSWDNGTLGNFWDNYLSLHPTATSLYGCWTTPYAISGTAGEVDNHPISSDILPTCSISVNDSNVIVAIMVVQFNFTGSQGNGPAAFLWNFGDGVTSSQMNPTHVYFTAGSYNVSLLVTDWDGDIANTSETNFVTVVDNLFPTPMFTSNVESIVAGGTVYFTFTGDEGNTPATFLWNFGDGTTSTAKNPSHLYTTPGTYTVRLTVTDDNGDSNSRITDITVTPPTTPEVSGFSTGCIVLAVVLGLAWIALKQRKNQNWQKSPRSRLC